MAKPKKTQEAPETPAVPATEATSTEEQTTSAPTEIPEHKPGSFIASSGNLIESF